MKQIEPISIPVNGENKTASEIEVIELDNFPDRATFYWELQGDNEVIRCGNCVMDEQQRADWDESEDAAYRWVSVQLNLMLL